MEKGYKLTDSFTEEELKKWKLRGFKYLTEEIFKKKDWQILTAGLLVEIAATNQVIMNQNDIIIAKLYNITEEEAEKQSRVTYEIYMRHLEREIREPWIWPDYDHTKKEE